MLAAENGHQEVVNSLVRAGADRETANKVSYLVMADIY